jgi:hypothetical protein
MTKKKLFSERAARADAADSRGGTMSNYIGGKFEEMEFELRARGKKVVAKSVGLAIYARMVRLAQDNNQVVGEKNDYYVTVEQLEQAFMNLFSEIGASHDQTK